MRRLIFFTALLLVGALLAPAPVAAQQNPEEAVLISSHQPDEALQGLVTVRGSTVAPSFLSYEVTFSYASDSTGTWFLIAEGNEVVQAGVLAEWDTTQIGDGNYNLRLTVFLQDGSRLHDVVPNLRVRNYSPIETLTPTPTMTATPPTLTAQPSLSPTATQPATETPIPPSVTPLPTNPATITSGQIGFSLLRGAAGALAFFLLAGLYASVQRILKRR